MLNNSFQAYLYVWLCVIEFLPFYGRDLVNFMGFYFLTLLSYKDIFIKHGDHLGEKNL